MLSVRANHQNRMVCSETMSSCKHRAHANYCAMGLPDESIRPTCLKILKTKHPQWPTSFKSNENLRRKKLLLCWQLEKRKKRKKILKNTRQSAIENILLKEKNLDRLVILWGHLVTFKCHQAEETNKQKRHLEKHKAISNRKQNT